MEQFAQKRSSRRFPHHDGWLRLLPKPRLHRKIRVPESREVPHNKEYPSHRLRIRDADIHVCFQGILSNFLYVGYPRILWLRQKFLHRQHKCPLPALLRALLWVLVAELEPFLNGNPLELKGMHTKHGITDYDTYMYNPRHGISTSRKILHWDEVAPCLFHFSFIKPVSYIFDLWSKISSNLLESKQKTWNLVFFFWGYIIKQRVPII